MLKDDPRNSTAMALRSNALLDQGQYDSAFEWAQKAVDRDGMRFDAMNNMAWILAEKKKDPARARPLIDQALKVAPWHPQLLDTSGWIQYLSGDYGQAIDTLEQSVRTSDSGVARYHLGLAFKLKAAKTINAVEKKKALQAARENLQQAVALGEKDPAPGEYLAPAREALKNLQHQ
jgi:tetratricopeptide (TPR) repeat protein